MVSADAGRTDLQGGQGALDGGFGQGAGLGQSLPQPDDAGKRIDHTELPALLGPGDQQAAIVGAEVKDRQHGRTPGPAAPPASSPPFPAFRHMMPPRSGDVSGFGAAYEISRFYAKVITALTVTHRWHALIREGTIP